MPTDQFPEGANEPVSKSPLGLRPKIEHAEEVLHRASRNRTLALGLGIPLFVMTLALLASTEEGRRQHFRLELQRLRDKAALVFYDKERRVREAYGSYGEGMNPRRFGGARGRLIRRYL